MILVHISYFLSLSVANCANFAIDIGLEIVILYERIYEIYGDIYAAKNCFDIDAYEMGKRNSAPILYYINWIPFLLHLQVVFVLGESHGHV